MIVIDHRSQQPIRLFMFCSPTRGEFAHFATLGSCPNC